MVFLVDFQVFLLDEVSAAWTVQLGLLGLVLQRAVVGGEVLHYLAAQRARVHVHKVMILLLGRNSNIASCGSV